MERQLVITQRCGFFEHQTAENAFNTQSTRPSTGHVGLIKIPGHQVKDPGIAIESFRQLLELPAELVFGVVIK